MHLGGKSEVGMHWRVGLIANCLHLGKKEKNKKVLVILIVVEIIHRSIGYSLKKQNPRRAKKS